MLEGRLLTAGFLALMWGLDYLTLNLALFLALGVFLATGGKHTLYLAYHTLPRDLRGAFRYLRLLFLVYTYQKRNLTVPKVFSKVASSHPNKPALLYESSSWSFGELEAYSNRVANYLTLHRGFRKGDCVVRRHLAGVHQSRNPASTNQLKFTGQSSYSQYQVRSCHWPDLRV